jgi:chromatin structure-remodeling complex subunit SFH1
MINYAEDGYDVDDDDGEDGIGRRRTTGLRSVRREETSNAARLDPGENVGKETYEPVEVQGIYREWMSRARYQRSDQVLASQALLPLTLIPIRLDVDIPAFTPAAAILAAPPPGALADPTPFRPGEPTVPYKLRDQFLWNLHESLITTDQFATTLVQDLDLPNPQNATVQEISRQIRTQLEEYAGVALHPLFRKSEPAKATGGNTPQTPADDKTTVMAAATLIRGEQDDLDPDDAYRCIINLSVNLSSALYTDKFEWSLLHPPAAAEMFAKQTCADLGLHGEWVPAITHAIYEAVLRLKKEACEAGGLVTGWAGQEHPNDAAQGTEAGWRHDPEQLGDEWEPKYEILSKEEMEKREIDRERQIRRLRRETARFSSTSGIAGGAISLQPDFGGFVPTVAPAAVPDEDRLGRGERSKKKRRFRSLSPLNRSGTPVVRGTPDVVVFATGGGAGGYGGGGSLTDNERPTWRCSHCKIRGTSVWAVRDGPAGPKVSCVFAVVREEVAPLTIMTVAVQQLWSLVGARSSPPQRNS